jgi:hypothetical protein
MSSSRTIRERVIINVENLLGHTAKEAGKSIAEDVRRA